MNLIDETAKLLERMLGPDPNFRDYGDVYTITVYKVCMDTRDGRRLYLAQTDPTVAHWRDAKRYEWQFEPLGAMEFEDKEEAEEFARKYFKHFDGWYIYETFAYRA